MHAPPIAIKHISKSFGKTPILEDVSVTLEKGEVFGLVGLNGVGKTTLIKIILDLARADAGEALLFGEASTHVRARHHLSYLPEKFSPSRYLTGHEYLSMVLAYYGLQVDVSKASQFAEAVDLQPDVLQQKVGGYSKGMGQKLGLLGAFMLEKPLMILDEPMSGLDPIARIKVKRLMLDAKKAGSTVFFSSHILADIDEICDRIAIMHDRRLIYIGSAADFKPAYQANTLESAFLAAISPPAAA